ncbi:hypothetical protein E1B28_007898 [Marasmius oreades]|uniref:CxC2-like cysteine cluster KDZ transposase-associated domain-containing protein n=1 Tax=Marasmius oreades TaxID=181124 RepID=A0A9P7S392_9AGAR|nr:uncharacterized protein E1B28_007898 [Marasmius oreades]KAG7094297.1 hypothetical protein E1B28_007898 [Marasmius oreades]
MDEPLHVIEVNGSKIFFNLLLYALLAFASSLAICLEDSAAFQSTALKTSQFLHGMGYTQFPWTFVVALQRRLMEMGLWPSSYKEPKSAATVQLLRNFQITNLHCQTPSTEFYEVLEFISDGTGLQKLPEREAQWMTMLRQYRNIKTAKRCGRGHDTKGIKGTSYGEAAVPCRACPHLERNLPAGWDKVSADDQFLYALYLCKDANFGQKARARPNDDRDPSLSPGWGCFVLNDLYMAEVSKRATQEEISHCVGFKAISTANTKKTKGLCATGISAVSCARHETFRPNGIGDLQVGERYINMDFLALFMLIGCGLSLVFFSYDIACQWVVNFRSRMAQFPEHMHLPNSLKLIFKVPKFYLIAHARKCLAKFSFNYTEGAAKTDGEGIEWNWSWLNACSRSLSMMKAGARWDMLDDFTNFWNWRKTINLETSLVKKLVKAIPEAVVNAHAFTAFTDALQDDHTKDLLIWQDQVVQWEQGLSNFCPYDMREETLTLAQVKKELTEEEHQQEVTGMNTSISTLSGLVIEGLEIEELQYVLLVR